LSLFLRIRADGAESEGKAVARARGRGPEDLPLGRRPPLDGINADLLEFKRGILDRVKRDLAGLQPLARKASAEDVQIIEDQMQGYQARLDLWYRFRARQTESAPIDTMRLTELRLGPVSKEVLR
jgi:hypothetical protein